jgi:hypothetical protein
MGDRHEELLRALKEERAAEADAAKEYDERAGKVFDALWAALLPHIAAVGSHYTDFAVDLSAEVYPVVERVSQLFSAQGLPLSEAAVPLTGEPTVFVLRNYEWRRQ